MTILILALATLALVGSVSWLNLTVAKDRARMTALERAEADAYVAAEQQRL